MNMATITSAVRCSVQLEFDIDPEVAQRVAEISGIHASDDWVLISAVRGVLEVILHDAVTNGEYDSERYCQLWYSDQGGFMLWRHAVGEGDIRANMGPDAECITTEFC
jgi:hypothetical protein